MFLLGPAVGIARGDLRHHGRERVVEIDPLGIGEAERHEQNVRELHRERPLGLFLLFGLLAEPMVDLPRELTDLFGESREIGERRKNLLILADPLIDRC
jgi:hypothetical protein